MNYHCFFDIHNSVLLQYGVWFMSSQRIDWKIEYSVKQQVIMSDLLFAIITTASTTLRRILHRALYSIGKKKKERKKERKKRTVTSRGRNRSPRHLLHVYMLPVQLVARLSFKRRKGPGSLQTGDRYFSFACMRACVTFINGTCGYINARNRSRKALYTQGWKQFALEYRKLRN